MTLLVGPNGSGKTRAMMRLASELIGKDRSENSTSITWGNAEAFDSTCTVYYTSAPYHLPGPKKGNQYRFIKTSLSSTDAPLAAEHQEIIDQLKSAFGLEARKTLTLPKVSEFEISHLLSLLERLHKDIADTWLAPYIKKHNELGARVRRPDGSLDWEALSNDSRQRTIIFSDFARELRSRIGSEFALKIRAYAYARSGRSQRPTAQMQILEALGFTLNRKVTKTPTVPKKAYDQALDKLRKSAAILGDELLKKSVYHIDDHQHEQINLLNMGKLGHLSLTELSSGAAALIHQFSSIEMACASLLNEGPYTNLVLLIDEGDAFLHLAWQQRYVDYLDKTAALLKQKFKSVQIVVATHSPVLMADFPRECTFILDGNSWFEDIVEDKTPRRPNESFGAPLDAVVREVGQTGTMGTFAARTIKRIVEDVSNGLQVSPQMVETIGDPIIRREVMKRLRERDAMEPKV